MKGYSYTIELSVLMGHKRQEASALEGDTCFES